MNARYENHPYFTAKLATRMEALGARLLRQVSTYPYPRQQLRIGPDKSVLGTARNQR